MKRRKDGTVYMEFNQASWDKGYTMRSNINPDCVKALKRWNKESGREIAKAIRAGDCKAIIREMSESKSRNRQIREISEYHDKIVYDATGAEVFWWDYKEQKMYELEH